MRRLAAVVVVALAGCSATVSDSRRGPLFCDEVPQPKRYLTNEEATGLGEDWIDIVVTILVRGKKHCGWDYNNPNIDNKGET